MNRGVSRCTRRLRATTTTAALLVPTAALAAQGPFMEAWSWTWPAPSPSSPGPGEESSDDSSLLGLPLSSGSGSGSSSSSSDFGSSGASSDFGRESDSDSSLNSNNLGLAVGVGGGGSQSSSPAGALDPWLGLPTAPEPEPASASSSSSSSSSSSLASSLASSSLNSSSSSSPSSASSASSSSSSSSSLSVPEPEVPELPTTMTWTTTWTTSTTITTTSTTGPHVFGGQDTQEAFDAWLVVWRSMYSDGLWKAGLPDPWESKMPRALKNLTPQIVLSSGGVAGGIVTEGMGYGLMIEGMLAASGSEESLQNGLSLMKSWLGMVEGPPDLAQPFAGGSNFTGSSQNVDYWPYGVSAIPSKKELATAGVAAWKFPIDESKIDEYMGSAADGDQDALFGMIYLSERLGNPDDMVDVVIRTLIAFASADLGFPDLYRILPCGTKLFVPKLGSMWGGLIPPDGPFRTKQEPWCYSPGYFAPAHYRTFRNFARRWWKPEFDAYLPKRTSGTWTTLSDLLEVFDSAVVAGYNILYYSSCSSGSVSNWVGVQAACDDNTTLNCEGIPWQYTPWVGPDGGECAQSGTPFGTWGADASRALWRIAMDYVLFREESSDVLIYDRNGYPDYSIRFSSRRFLNRISRQYKIHAWCDGGAEGNNCLNRKNNPFRLAPAFDPKYHPPGLNCSGVPFGQMSWWAGFMAYPTFSAFVAPYDEIGAIPMSRWMDTFSRICDFSEMNFSDYQAGGQPVGQICYSSYFESSQAVISWLIMAGKLRTIQDIDPTPPTLPWLWDDDEDSPDGEANGVSSDSAPAFGGLQPIGDEMAHVWQNLIHSKAESLPESSGSAAAPSRTRGAAYKTDVPAVAGKPAEERPTATLFAATTEIPMAGLVLFGMFILFFGASMGFRAVTQCRQAASTGWRKRRAPPRMTCSPRVDARGISRVTVAQREPARSAFEPLALNLDFAMLPQSDVDEAL